MYGWVRRDEDGSVAAEQVAVLVIVASLVASVVSLEVPAVVAAHGQHAVCALFGGCDGGSLAAGGGGWSRPAAAGGPAPTTGGPQSADDRTSGNAGGAGGGGDGAAAGGVRDDGDGGGVVAGSGYLEQLEGAGGAVAPPGAGATSETNSGAGSGVWPGPPAGSRPQLGPGPPEAVPPAGGGNPVVGAVRWLDGRLRQAAGAEMRWALAVHTGRASVRVSRWANAAQQIYYLQREAHTAMGGAHVAAGRRLQATHRAALAGRIRQLRGGAAAAVAGLARAEPLTRLGRAMETATSGPARWLRLGSRTLGLAGAAYSGVEMFQRLDAGKPVDAAASGLMAVGGGLMLIPGAGAVGAAMVGVGLVIEHRDTIARAAGQVAVSGRRAASTAAAAAGRSVSAATDRVRGWFGR